MNQTSFLKENIFINVSEQQYNHFLFHKSILYEQSAKTDMKLQYLKRDSSYNDISEVKNIAEGFKTSFNIRSANTTTSPRQNQKAREIPIFFNQLCYRLQSNT